MKIKIENLNKTFGKKKIIDNSSLEFPEKGLVGIVGDNGCGKTTLFNILALLDGDYSGNIFYDSKNIKNYTKKERIEVSKEKISVLFQEDNLISYLNLNDNVNLFNYINKDEYKDIPDGFYGKRIKNLSSGEKVLVCLERFFNSNKQVLILDEFTDYLNIKTINEILPKIMEISETKLVVFSSHDPYLINKADLIYEFTNKKIVLKKGNIIREKSFETNDDAKKKKKNKKIFPKLSLATLKQNFLLTMSVMLVDCFATICSFGFTAEYSQNYKQIDKSYLNKNEGDECKIKRFVTENLYKFNDFNDLEIASSNAINEKEKIKIRNDGEIDCFLTLDSTTNSYSSLLFDEDSAEKVVIPKNLYNNFEFVGDKVKIEYSDNVYALSDYKIDDNSEKNKATLSTNQLKKLLFINGFPVKLSMWNNKNFSIHNSFDVRKLFDDKQVNRFISKTSLEYRENKNIDFEIEDNIFYIDKSLNYYYTDENLEFFNLDCVNMRGDELNYVNFNDDFDSLKLVKNDSIDKYLGDKEILVSDTTFEKIRSSYFNNINLNYISKKTTNDHFISFLNDNNFVFYDNNGHYSSCVFVNLRPILKQLFITLIVISLLIIIIVNCLLIFTLFRKNTENNKILISSGISRNKVISITLFPYYLINFSMILSYILFYFFSIRFDFASHNYSSSIFTNRNFLLLLIYFLTQFLFLLPYYIRFKKGNFKI